MTREEAIRLIDERMCFGRGKWSKHHMPVKDIYWQAGEMAIKALKQPEPCVDTIDALNESIKHFDDLAEECRRNANIERNDYMDMRDDAAEYRQLSIWLNELKWLRERFQSQSEQKWIPVSKKLPKEDVPVLVTDDAGGMATVGIDSCGRYEDTGERFWYTSQNVTAWMDTVEPYGGEQE